MPSTVQSVKRRLLAVLIGLGHQTIGVIALPVDVSASDRRIEGIRQAHREAGLTLADDLLEVASFSEQEGFAAARRVLARQPRPDALVACSLRLTTGALAALHAGGLRVPHDVALVGYDEMPWTLLCQPPLTVVQQPARELGHRAAALLLSRLDGSQASGPVSELLQPSLLVRRSCGAQPETPVDFGEFESVSL
jgi:DNA-binding LacI/PurR family transcriptional regulator